MMKKIFLMLLFFSMFAYSQIPIPDAPDSPVTDFFTDMYLWIKGTFWLLSIVLVLMAAIVYALGQTVGAETKARANQWASGMATMAIVAAVIYALIPWLIVQLIPQTTVAATGPAKLVYEGWEWFAMAAALLSVLVATMLLMLSRAFNLKMLEQTAKAEMAYAASTAMIVLMLIVLISVVEPILVKATLGVYVDVYQLQGRLVYNDDMTLINITKMHMAPVIGCVDGILDTMYKMSIVLEPLTSAFMEIYMSEHASGFGFKIMTERINNTTQILFFYVYAYFILVHILNFIQYYGLAFLTIGIVLRAFPPTRGAGAYIIAMSLGLYFVFPLSYVILNTLVSSYSGDATNLDCNYPLAAGDIQVCGFEDANKIQDLKSWVEMNRDDLTSFFDYFSYRILRDLATRICFIPFVCLVIVLTFILNTSSLFGGNIPEIGRGIVKLI